MWRKCLLIQFILVAVAQAAASQKDKKIVIVGAGVAGLATAKELLAKGYESIQILEAQDYYGGRVRQIVDEDGSIIQFGAQRIEGRHSSNSAFKILKDAERSRRDPDEPEPKELPLTFSTPRKPLAESAKSDDKIYVQSNGDAFPVDDLKPFFDVIDASLLEVHGSTELLSDYYRKLFNDVSDDPKKIGLALSFCQIYAETHSPASDWDQTIGIGFGQQKKIPGGEMRPPGGMKTLLYAMMDAKKGKINDQWKNMLKLNSEVKTIKWNSTRPVVSYLDRVTGENHDIEADFVIVTVSLGVLKATLDKMFHPSLPETQIEAINAFNFGLENQIYLKFSERWWPVDKELHIIWRPEDKSALQVIDRWLPKIEVYVPYNNDTLMIYVMESENYHSDDLSEQQLIEKVMPIIRRGFQHQNWTITNPEKVFHSKWYANEFIRGALTYPTAVSHKKGLKNSDLAPVLKNFDGKTTLLFAGEGTSNDYYGSLHGAVDSGVQAAHDIMNAE